MKTTIEVGVTAPATSDKTLPPKKAESPTRPRPRWRRRLIVISVLLVVIIACHAPILRFVGELLVSNDPLVPTDAVVIFGSSGPYRAVPIDEVADLYQKGFVREIVLIEDRSSRIAKARIVPTLENVMIQELATRDIPTTALTTLAREYQTGSEATRALGTWLKNHPNSHVTVLCDQFHSRNSAYLAHNVLEATEYDRIHWHVIMDRRFDVSNWWHTRQGIVEVVSAYVSLLHSYLVGEPTESVKRWDPDEFERTLRERAVP